MSENPLPQRHVSLTQLDGAVDAARFLGLIVEEGLTSFGDELAFVKYLEVKKKPQVFTTVVCEINYPTPLTIMVTEVHYVFLKKNVSRSFDYDFGKGPGIKCNKAVLEEAAQKGAFVTFVVHRGYILTIKAAHFLEWAMQHDAVYATKYGGDEERDCMMPISLMTQVFPKAIG